jgi:hypothetical protein
MKAPEKIYLRKRNKLPLEVVCDKWYETDPQNIYGSVEYTRTNAFIEKATSYIQQHWIWNTKMIEDFKNYMKEDKL